MIFISYSWSNKPAAHKVVEALAVERIPCWLDEQQLSAGVELRASLRSAIAEANVYIYLISDSANNSRWCQDELRYAIALEHERKLQIVPVRLADNDDPPPPLLLDRMYFSLEPTQGGVARLAHTLAAIDGHDTVQEHNRLSATVRLEKHRLVHTLRQACEISSHCPVSILLLDDKYEALDDQYWRVAEVRFPPVEGSPQELSEVANFIAATHEQSRAIIKEVRAICARHIARTRSVGTHSYFDAGHERALRVMLHRLQWNTSYLVFLRDDTKFGRSFVDARDLESLFDGHECDFVSSGEKVGTSKVPKYGHPFPRGVDNPGPWGLTNPFADMPPNIVGTAIGELVALRFMAQSLLSAELPPPESLTYGLS